MRKRILKTIGLVVINVLVLYIILCIVGKIFTKYHEFFEFLSKISELPSEIWNGSFWDFVGGIPLVIIAVYPLAWTVWLLCRGISFVIELAVRIPFNYIRELWKDYETD